MSGLPTVCFLTGTLNAFAGAERMTAVIANALAERGYRVFVLSLWDRASVFPLHEGVEHHALFEERPSFKRMYFSTVLGIRRFVREHGIDVLIEVDTMLTLFTLPATLGVKVRRIAWEHCHFDEDLGRKARRVARWLAGRFDETVVVLTERDRERWQSALKPSARLVRIVNPLPFPFPGRLAERTSHEVLAVGRLTHAKGFDILLRAWQVVVTIHPSWTLKIVGDGEERGALEALAASLQIQDSVTFAGARHDLSGTYGNASIFCLSSRYEGYGLVLIEAMAHGLPIVSTDCETGPREILVDNVNALTVPVDDSTSMASAICELIERTDIASNLAQTGRTRAACLDISRIIPAWVSLMRTEGHPRQVDD